MSSIKKGGGRQGKAPRLGVKPKGKQKPPFTLEPSDQPRLTAPREKTVSVSARPGQRLGEFTIDRLSHDGRGLTQWQGKTLFVEGALVGEKVTARFVREQGRFAEARVDEVISAAAERLIPPCPHYVQCGGCQLQHMQPEAQLTFKQGVVLEQLARWAQIVPYRVLPPITSAGSGYRSRARLGVWYEKDAGVTLGFRQGQSKQLVPINACLVLPESLNQLLEPLRSWLVSHSAKAVTHVELLMAESGPVMVLRHTKKPGERDWQGLRQLAEQVSCDIWLDDGRGSLQDLQGQAVDPRLDYTLSAFDVTLGYHPQDFIQVNPAVNAHMVEQALQLLKPQSHERILDLFCGIGNFTLPLATRCAQVIGVEAVESMVERGRENAVRAQLGNLQFMAADLTRLSVQQLQQRCGAIDAILLDPPREGAREILSKIAGLAASRILYVSCNPATFARDAKILADQGYRLESLGVMDMFPHTVHVESMGLFVRA